MEDNLNQDCAREPGRGGSSTMGSIVAGITERAQRGTFFATRQNRKEEKKEGEEQERGERRGRGT